MTPFERFERVADFHGSARPFLEHVVGNEPGIYGEGQAKSTRSQEEKPLKSPFRKPRAEPRPASLPAGERVYAVGDIHGRLDLFDQLVAQIEADNAVRGKANVGIILLGDLVDRGPDSRAMVECAMGWSEGFARLEVLLGNHEASMLAACRGDTRLTSSWLTYGGRETLLSYGVPPGLLAIGSDEELAAAAQGHIPQDHRDWLDARPLSIINGDYWFVHAGIMPGVALDDQDARDLLWIRDEFLDSDVDHGGVVIHGHSISEEVEERPNRIGIDTGAYASGRLTALGLEGEERWYLQTQ